MLICSKHDFRGHVPCPACKLEKKPMSWKPEVQTAGNGDDWDGNALVFAEKAEAEAWVKDLSHRWMAVTATRVVESEEEPNR